MWLVRLAALGVRDQGDVVAALPHLERTLLIDSQEVALCTPLSQRRGAEQAPEPVRQQTCRNDLERGLSIAAMPGKQREVSGQLRSCHESTVAPGLLGNGRS